MTTKFGLHVASGSRNGYGDVVAAAPAVVLAVGEGGALVEAKQKGGGRPVTIYREQTVFNDAPPGIDQMSEAEAAAAADRYWPQLRERYRLNPADYYQTTNEYGGNNPIALRNLVAFETRLMELAERDGFKLAVGSAAGGSPGDWDLWERYYVPLIVRAGQGGHVYSRHAYGGVESTGSGLLTAPDGTPADGNAGRPFREAAYLRDHGISTRMVITEAGQNGGYRFPGVDVFMADMIRYDRLCQQHENIIGFCAWTYGRYLDFPTNMEAASPAIATYLREAASQPPPPPPARPRGAPRVPFERTYVLLHSSLTKAQIFRIVEENLPYRRTFGFSADDAGLGDLDVRHVHVYGWPLAERSILVEWFAYWYPGTVVTFQAVPPDPAAPPASPSPETGPARIGLHMDADPGRWHTSSTQEAAVMKPEAIKVLTAHAPESIAELAAAAPDVIWIARAFLRFSGRVVSPDQFYDWTRDDIARLLQVLAGRPVVLEAGNEPNLRDEGAFVNWRSGSEFANWIRPLVARYRAAFPGLKLIFPALSPHGHVPDLVLGHDAFLDGCSSVLSLFDGIGVHAYWADGFKLSDAVEHVRSYARFGKPIYVTEASRNDRPAVHGADRYARDYLEFWRAMKTIPLVQAVTYFVSAASDPTFHAESWVVDRQSKGIGALVGSRS